jgi:transposase-like protein
VTKASDAIWPKALRLGCWFHKRPHLQQPGPPQAWPELKTLVAARRDAPTVPEAQRRRHRLGNRSQRDFPAACRCLRDEAQASLNHLYVPQRHPPYVRPSPLAERAVEEERRRPTVIPPVWDEGRVVKLLFAVVLRGSERWGKKCFSEFDQHQIGSLRRQRHLDEQTVLASPARPQPRRSAASAA